MHRPETTPRTLRQFAVAWLIFVSAIGAQQYFARGRHVVGTVCFVAAVVFGMSGLIKPPLIRWLFVLLTTVAFPIGWLVSQLMLAASWRSAAAGPAPWTSAALSGLLLRCWRCDAS